MRDPLRAITIFILGICATAPVARAGTLPAGVRPGVVKGPITIDSLGVEYQIHPTRLSPDDAVFLKESNLEAGYIQASSESWRFAARNREFEQEEFSLEEFSEIDIPIKFPDTIGRVIGQGANLSVSGSEQISFGGRTRYQVDEPLTEYGRRSKFPTLDMKQHLKIDLKGTVGEKIHVMVHHDSEIDTPLENRIKLRYEGYDDEIVQSVEMGNTSLRLPGSQFVSYSGQQKGLFGAKMLAKLGALDLTAIASRQEGVTAAARKKFGVEQNKTTLDDLSFVRNKYFFLRDPHTFVQGADFDSVRVYLDDGDYTNDDEQGAVPAYVFLQPPGLDRTDEWPGETKVSGKFTVLERNRDYAINDLTGELSLLRPVSGSQTLAVRYIYNGVPVGGYDAAGRLVLKMLRPADQELADASSPWAPTLDLMRRNIYALDHSYISEENVRVEIFRNGPTPDPNQETYDYSLILGVDLFDENERADEDNGWQTDGYADGGTVNGEQGLLIFPDLRPFDPNYATVTDRPETLLTDNQNPDIYDRPYSEIGARRDEYTKFTIEVSYSTPTTSIKLDHINILDGSEVVTLDGTRLVRNTDYQIYYDIGQIKLDEGLALTPDAEIVVDYQYVPFFATAQQSLLGLQGIYRLSDRSHIGSVVLFQSKKSPEERPRLGQEPSRIVLGDLNAKLEFRPELMTAMVNALPLIRAEQPSRLSLAGEVGMSVPNPNTKGEVYVDDMEGVSDTRSFSLARDAWVQSSPPEGYDYEDTRKI
jgi:hypothetical protein